MVVIERMHSTQLIGLGVKEGRRDGGPGPQAQEG
jgi:hypothetical protein